MELTLQESANTDSNNGNVARKQNGVEKMSYIYEKKQSSDLYHDLKKMGRDNFSYDGAAALMEYLENMAEDTDSPLEYDPIAFCCEFAEYQDSEYESLADEYDSAPQKKDYEDSEEFESALIQWLQDNTTVIEFDGGIIIQSF